MRAPFPYFGGKSRIAETIWMAIGDVQNYVEPFAGSAAVLLARPDGHTWWQRTETINDADGLVSNFWRAVQAAPDAVAHHADWPVIECDLHARHAAIVAELPGLTARIEGDATYFDARIAGWWVWGICCWIGSGFASGNGPWRVVDGELVNTRTAGQGINRQLPHLGDAGQGINRQLPHNGTAGQGHCAVWHEHLLTMMSALSNRLRRVRVCSGDWTRVLSDSVTIRHGTTGVLLDPPYALDGRQIGLYRHDTDISSAVRAWAITNGDNPLYRIVLCGYDSDHEMPESWREIAWKASKGYGGQRAEGSNENRHRERLWLSPHCLADDAVLPLFAGLEVAS